MDVSLTPSIYVSNHSRRLSKSPAPRSPTSYPSSTPSSSHPSPSAPMAIPDRTGSANPSSRPPPALPPPKYPEEMGVRVQTPPTRFWGNNSNPHFTWKGFESGPSALGPFWQGRSGSREEDDDGSDIDPTRRASTITVKPMRRNTEETASPDEEDRLRRPSVLFRGYRCVYFYCYHLLPRSFFLQERVITMTLFRSHDRCCTPCPRSSRTETHKMTASRHFILLHDSC